ncbi:serine/threonine protein kinase [Streptosporangium album]|uniref:Serine/threonine protein kinase n=1 Tax=Streptosporangium album TaxID=47479 RepID=A0A7W7S5I0_9ACTN|nr:serine/threonine protein kinase [Streptosporangium album]MBB4944072.1 serine/threonine protein kinase [Streptosporangium album]
MVATPLTPDDPLRLGAFRLAGRLGEGGQGVVYLAHTPSGEPVAVKALFRADPEWRTRLSRELSALESVAPFCTARVLDASVDGPQPYVVSEFVDGPSLQERIRERGPLHGGELERLLVGTATALAAIHAAGVVHRDFKPANVLLGPDGPRVVDFGIARAEGAATMTSGLIGTPAYLSPEQIAGSPASPASDVFAWAATMVCAASGLSPFGADTLPAVLHRILNHQPDLSALPARFVPLVAACLNKDPAGRPTARALMVSLVDPGGQSPPSTGELARAGSRIAADPGLTGPGRSSLTTQASARRRRGIVVGTGLAGASLVIAAGVAAWIFLGDRPAMVAQSTATPTSAQVTGSPGTPSTSPEPVETGTVRPPAETGTPRPPAAGGSKIPAAFAGTWTGHIKPSIAFGLEEHDVTIGLVAGKGSGTWEEPTSGCAAVLDLTGATGTALTFDLRPDRPDDCVPGTLTLTRRGDALAYHWVDGLGFGTSYDGDLAKS